MEPLSEDFVSTKIRKMFPALERYAYFTTNGLGVLSSGVARALHEMIDDLPQNAIVSAIFRNGPLVVEARGRVARLLGCDPAEIAFCRNTSEGVLWAANSLRWRAGDEVLVAQGEYPANVLPWMAQESRGVTTRLLRLRRRRITPELVAESWSPRTRLLAISFVQYNSGFRADLRALAEVVHARGALLFCDGIQGLGALRLDVGEAGVDLLAAGTHKWLLGLQGLGIFYCRRALLAELDATHVATGSLVQDHDPEDPDAPYDRDMIGEARRFEEGTRNYLGIVALNESLRLIEEIGIDCIEARVGQLTDYLVSEVERRGCRVESPRAAGEWSGIVLFAPPSGAPPANEIVSAMHQQRITINAREGCIHMGVHFYNTRADIDRMLQVFDEQAGGRGTKVKRWNRLRSTAHTPRPS
jgi:selenocysteine lyase/cysteine desulfurase